MSKKNKIFYIILLAVIICLPGILSPFTIEKNNADIILYDNKQPSSFADLHLDGSFFSSFETLFNEHVPFRHDIISYWSDAMFLLNVSAKPNSIVVGQNSWLYLGNQHEQILNLHRGLLLTDENVLNTSALHLTALDEFLSGNDIDFLFFVPPDKYAVYPENLPFWYTSTANAAQRYTAQLFANLSGTPAEEKSLNLIDTLVEQKVTCGDHLYGKTDSHWSLLGAYFGYSAVMDRLDTLYGGYPKLSLDDYQVVADDGFDQKSLLGLSLPLDDFLIVPNFSPSADVVAETLAYGNSKSLLRYKNSAALCDKTLLVIGDSFVGGNLQQGTECMIPYLTNTFNTVYFIHFNDVLNMDHVSNLFHLINSYDPDLVLFESVERQADIALLNMPDTYLNPKDAFIDSHVIYQYNAPASGGEGNIQSELVIDNLSEEYGSIVVKLSADCPEYTAVNVFYSDHSGGEYSDENMISDALYMGANTLYLMLDADFPISSIKLQLDHPIDLHVISELKISAVS